MKKTSRLALLLALVLALAAPALAATFTTGKYQGNTSQKKKNGKHRKISFHADNAAQQITNLKFTETGTCNDGGSSTGDQKGLHADVDAAGNFVIKGSSPSGATKLTLNGSIAGTKASGTFTVKSRFNKAGNPDKNGKIKCTTGTVKWKASFVG
jgi:hypothetical protein